MITELRTRRYLVALLLGTMAAAAAGPVSAEEDMFDGKWHFAITPYLFLPKAYGAATYQSPVGAGGSISATIDPSSYLESLDFAAMIAGSLFISMRDPLPIGAAYRQLVQERSCLHHRCIWVVR